MNKCTPLAGPRARQLIERHPAVTANLPPDHDPLDAIFLLKVGPIPVARHVIKRILMNPRYIELSAVPRRGEH